MNTGVTTADRPLSRTRHKAPVQKAARRRELRSVAVVALCALLGLYGTSLRPRMLTWGATSDEIDQVYPGDEFVPDATGGATMATTLPAPPDQVWRWLIQMGGDRAGWYSWDWLDNNGTPSANRIVPAWQDVAVGQHLPRVGMSPGSWTVVVAEPNRTLVLLTAYELTGRSLDPQSCDPRPATWTEGIWGFHLHPAPCNQTRLTVRTRNQSSPRWLGKPFSLLIGEPVHFIMQTLQLHHLRARIDANPQGPAPTQ